MIRRLVCVAGLALCATLHAQTIAGIWQGTLPAGSNPRIVAKIAKAEDGSLRGTLNFIDESASAAPLLSVTFVAPELKMTLGGLSFDGKLSADGQSIAGTWTRQDVPSPLTFRRATAETTWTYGGPPPVAPMSVAADPSFEVATVKPSRPEAKQRSFKLRTERFQANNADVTDLIKFAYNLRDRQISGGPSSRDDQKFDIAGTPNMPGLPSMEQDRTMMRKLLAERFGLVVHSVQRVVPVYALVIEKSPVKVTQSPPNAELEGSIYPRGQADGQTAVQFAFMTMREFTNILMNFIQDRQIVDETGLVGQYDFTMMIPSSALQGEQADGIDKASAFLRGVEPLGFKLVPRKEAIEHLVIDHLDQPTPN